MNRYLEIKSRGEMEIQAITLIGASTKRDDHNKIGQFGSGLPYSIASIVRQGINLRIFSGTNEIKIETKQVEFRNKTYNQIFINGKETSYVDSMGTDDWNGVFPFVREIYSNALDEDPDATMEWVDIDDVPINSGYTRFLIEETPEIKQMFDNFDQYFIKSEKAIFADEIRGEIHKKNQSDIRIFRKGILAFHDENQRSIFSYNLYDAEINESRVIKNIYGAQNQIARLIESCTDKRILRKWLNGIKGGNAGYFEHDCILWDWVATVSNPVFVEFILENKYYPLDVTDLYDDEDKKGRIGLPVKLLRRFLTYAPDVDILGMTSKQDPSDSNFYRIKSPSSNLFDKVNDAIQVLRKTDYHDRLKTHIEYAAFKDKMIRGYADNENDRILLSINLEDCTVDEIALIIIEEEEHLRTGFDDETRHFQSHFIKLYYNMLLKQAR